MSRARITRRQLLGVAATTAVTGLVLAREAHVLGNAGAAAGAARSDGAEGSAEASDAIGRARPLEAWLDGMLTGEDLALANAALASLSSSAPRPRIASAPPGVPLPISEPAPSGDPRPGSSSVPSSAPPSRSAPLSLPASQPPRILEPDLVWQWRRGLAQQLSSGVRAVAITRWDKALLLSDLAREAALPVRRERIGHSLFQTEIG
jgi:hypothetical protein